MREQVHAYEAINAMVEKRQDDCAGLVVELSGCVLRLMVVVCDGGDDDRGCGRGGDDDDDDDDDGWR